MDEKLSPKAEAHRRAYAMFEQAKIPVALFSLDGKFLNCNSALCALFGYAEAEMRALDLMNLVHPEDRLAARMQFGSFFNGGHVDYSAERRYLKKNRQEMRMRLYGSLVRDEQGRPDFVVAMFQDIVTELAERTRRERSERISKAALECVGGPAFILDKTGAVLASNEEAATRLGVLPHQLVGMTVFDFMPKSLGETRRKQYADVIRVGHPFRYEGVRDGRHLDTLLCPIFNELGEVDRVAAYATDITELRRAQAERIKSEARFRKLFELSPDPMLMVDSLGTVRLANAVSRALFEKADKPLQGSLCPCPFQPESVTPFVLESVSGPLEFEVRAVQLDASDTASYLVSLRDVTQFIRATEQLRDLCLMDDLTGLYNRRGFLSLARQHLLVANRSGRELVLVFLDMDGLKTINDTHGHVEGDKALLALSDVLRTVFRRSDIIARMGGDEFAVLALDTASDVAELVSRRLRLSLKEANQRLPGPWQLNVSCGTVVYKPSQPCDLQELLDRADAVMYAEKRVHRTGSSQEIPATKAPESPESAS